MLDAWEARCPTWPASTRPQVRLPGPAIQPAIAIASLGQRLADACRLYVQRLRHFGRSPTAPQGSFITCVAAEDKLPLEGLPLGAVVRYDIPLHLAARAVEGPCESAVWGDGVSGLGLARAALGSASQHLMQHQCAAW